MKVQITERFQKSTENLSWPIILSSLSAGIVIGILLIFVVISFAAMVFSGDLTPYIAQGIGIMLFGLAFFASVGALFSSFPNSNFTPQDGPVAILAVIVTTIAANFQGTGESLFLSVMATIVMTTFLTGVFFYLLGRFRLGNLIRYIPFPVVGGFLAGAGWLLVTGSLGVMTGLPLGGELLRSEALIRWLPGLIFALVLFIALQLDTPFWTLPALLVGGVAVFYLAYGLLNGEVATAEGNGWLLGPFPSGGMWQIHIFDVVREADWQLVFGQLPDIGTVMLVSVITFLLNVGALSVATQQDIDMNGELRVAGIANIVGSLAACSIGYTSVSLSSLGHRLAEGSRLVGIIVGALAAVAVLVGASFLNFFPRVVAGGFLLFLGLTFIYDWIISARSKVPRLEYVLMWLIVLMVVFIGFLEAVFAGILISTILFAINYSRTRTTRLAVTAESYQSQVQRPLLYQQLLKRHGDKLHILSLQGYIFFGIGDKLLESMKARLAETEPEYFIIDFRLVTGIDSSAMLSLSKISQLAEQREIHLVFTGLRPELELRLKKELFRSKEDHFWPIFPELDMGVAWCEDQLIAGWESVGLTSRPASICQQWLALAGVEEGKTEEDNLAALLEGKSGRRKSSLNKEFQNNRLDFYLEQRAVDAGETIVEESERFDGLILVESGQVMAQIINVDGTILNVKIFEEGNILGELGQYAQRSSRLAVIATETAVVYLLSGEKIKEMQTADPPLAIALHRLVAAQLSERNLQLDDMVQALQF